MSVAKAEFSSIGRDLFWRHFDMVDGFIRWSGYDDANWWKNVAPSGATRTGKSGRVYTINYTTNEVTVTEPTSRPTPTATKAAAPEAT